MTSRRIDLAIRTTLHYLELARDVLGAHVLHGCLISRRREHFGLTHVDPQEGRLEV